MMKYLTFTWLFLFFTCCAAAQTADTAAVYTLADTVVANRLLEESIYLNSLQKYNEAYSKAESAQVIVDQTTGRSSNKMADVMQQKGKAMLYAGNPKKSIELFKESLTIRTNLFGEDNLEASFTMYNIGRTYYLLNDKENAFVYINRAIRIMDKRLKSSDLALTSAYIIWGVLNQEKGNMPEAIKSYSNVINALKGTAHMNLAFAYSNLATIYERRKDYQKSLDFHFKALDIRINTLGATSLQTSDSYHNIGVSYWEIDFYKACYYLQKGLEIRLSVQDENNGRLISSFLGIGAILQEKKQFKESLDYYNKALNASIADGDDISASICYYNIATTHEDLLNYDSALHYYFKSLELGKKTLDVNYGNLPMCQGSIAQIYKKKGEIDKSIYFLNEAIISCGYRENLIFQNIELLNELIASLSQLAYMHNLKYLDFGHLRCPS